MAGFFKKLISGLTKTRDNVVSGLNSIFTDSARLMMISMRNWKKCSLWAISVLPQRRRLSMI